MARALGPVTPGGGFGLRAMKRVTFGRPAEWHGSAKPRSTARLSEATASRFRHSPGAGDRACGEEAFPARAARRLRGLSPVRPSARGAQCLSMLRRRGCSPARAPVKALLPGDHSIYLSETCAESVARALPLCKSADDDTRRPARHTLGRGAGAIRSRGTELPARRQEIARRQLRRCESAYTAAQNSPMLPG